MDGGKTGGAGPPLSPLGHPVVSSYGALSQRIREDLLAHGSRAQSPFSALRLQALYVDFGRVALVEHLREAVLRAIEDARDAAGVPREDRRPEAQRPLRDDMEEDSALVRARLGRMSRRALMAALVFNSHFWNIRLALEVVGGEAPLERAALGTCAFVAERRVGRSVGGDLRYYAPVRERREGFCSDHCLPAIAPRRVDHRPWLPPQTAAACGMVAIFEAFRFFAAFPDE